MKNRFFALTGMALVGVLALVSPCSNWKMLMPMGMVGLNPCAAEESASCCHSGPEAPAPASDGCCDVTYALQKCHAAGAASFAKVPAPISMAAPFAAETGERLHSSDSRSFRTRNGSPPLLRFPSFVPLLI